MTDLTEILTWTDEALWAGFVVFLRIGAAMSLIPGFGEQTVPIRVKLGLAVIISVALLADLPPPPPMTQTTLLRLAISEPLIGLMLGLGLRLFLMAIQTAGSIAAQSTSLAQISAGAFPDPMPAIGQFLSMAAVTLFFLLDLHVQAVLLLKSSYSVFPVGAFPDATSAAEWGIGRINESFLLAFRLAAPFFLLSLVYNVTLGAINRAMPQLMVVFVGAPLITWGSLAVLLLAAPTILVVWASSLGTFMLDPFGNTP